MKKSAITSSALFSAALLASLGLSQAANADPSGQLFSAVSLDRGYMVSVGEGKCGEGKCGGEKEAEGKCGEGKCGGDAGGEGKDTEGKCGEGKCGTA